MNGKINPMKLQEKYMKAKNNPNNNGRILMAWWGIIFPEHYPSHQEILDE